MACLLTVEQEELRDNILGISRTNYLYGVGNYDNLTLTQLAKLVENDFIKLDYSFNASPKVRVFFDFMTKYPAFKCFGFSTKRKDDYTLVISGIEGSAIGNKDAVIEFSNLFRLADEFCASVDYCRAWYD